MCLSGGLAIIIMTTTSRRVEWHQQVYRTVQFKESRDNHYVDYHLGSRECLLLFTVKLVLLIHPSSTCTSTVEYQQMLVVCLFRFALDEFRFASLCVRVCACLQCNIVICNQT